ncbi:MAG: hypothetical protein COU69_03545 [Candidatus Pacebacteria bacterium CG10_big_fil_rev_8_21_14_0_10_56_10]|nr:MAG: hypothetical protein COU69_03545 [Candidatus Pacebacteria bacterium CG10_big_fil_rev_8_21_14_0_10_56_10]
MFETNPIFPEGDLDAELTSYGQELLTKHYLTQPDIVKLMSDDIDPLWSQANQAFTNYVRLKLNLGDRILPAVIADMVGGRLPDPVDQVEFPAVVTDREVAKVRQLLWRNPQQRFNSPEIIKQLPLNYRQLTAELAEFNRQIYDNATGPGQKNDFEQYRRLVPDVISWSDQRFFALLRRGDDSPAYRRSLGGIEPNYSYIFSDDALFSGKLTDQLFSKYHQLLKLFVFEQVASQHQQGVDKLERKVETLRITKKIRLLAELRPANTALFDNFFEYLTAMLKDGQSEQLRLSFGYRDAPDQQKYEAGLTSRHGDQPAPFEVVNYEGSPDTFSEKLQFSLQGGYIKVEGLGFISAAAGPVSVKSPSFLLNYNSNEQRLYWGKVTGTRIGRPVYRWFKRAKAAGVPLDIRRFFETMTLVDPDTEPFQRMSLEQQIDLVKKTRSEAVSQPDLFSLIEFLNNNPHKPKQIDLRVNQGRAELEPVLVQHGDGAG